MPHFDIVKEFPAKKTFRVASVMDAFDMQHSNVCERFTGNIEIESKKWNIGAIVGGSGTGKSTIAKNIFGDKIVSFEYGNESIIDEMPKGKTIAEITSAFGSVGFASPPSWLKPYSVLSMGEKMRVDLAKAILSDNDIIVFDEFTSVVDRIVAKTAAFSISKTIRKIDKKFIAIACHKDILDWLEPDWVYDTDEKIFFFSSGKYKRPELNIEVYKFESSKAKKIWEIFRKYHYLSHDYNSSWQSYVAFMDEQPIAFCSVLHFPHPINPKIKRISRVVVLPDYQGFGLGSRIVTFVGKIYQKLGFDVILTTSAKNFIKSLLSKNEWKLYRFGKVAQNSATAKIYWNLSCDRNTYSFELKK